MTTAAENKIETVGEDEGMALTALMNQPKSVLRRVKALKKLQLAEIDLESKFHGRLNQLEKEFQPLFETINNQRKAIITGEYEPKDEECDIPLLHGMPDEELKKIETGAPPELSGVKGIPDFWLDVLLNCAELEPMIRAEDFDMLKHLTDIKCELHQNDAGFTLLFYFDENPFFTNRVLKKSYVMKTIPDAENPFDYDGPFLHSAKADAINWTVQAAGGGKRNIHGEVIRSAGGMPSFFDFFDPTLKVYSDEMGEDDEFDMDRDFDIAMLIRDSIIPRAVLYLTDEMVQDDGSFGDSFDSDDDESSGDENLGGGMDATGQSARMDIG